MKGIKVDEKWYKNILIYYFEYETFKDVNYVKINSVNPLHVIIGKINGYFKEIYANKYLPLVPTNENKKIKKTYKERWCKIKDLIRSKTNNSDDYHKNYMRIKFNSDDNLPLNEKLWLHNVIIVIRFVFHEILPLGFLR